MGAFAAAAAIALVAGGAEAKGPRTKQQCIDLIGEMLFASTLKATPKQVDEVVAFLKSAGLTAAADCVEANKGSLQNCRELLIAAIHQDIATRSDAQLEELEHKARGDGLVDVADCLAQLRGAP